MIRVAGCGLRGTRYGLRVAGYEVRVTGYGKWHRAERIGHGAKGRALRAWGVEQDDLKPEYLTSVL